MRILVVEDDPKIAAALSKSLRAEGYAVDAAHDGVTGERQARVCAYDLIILDVMLPGRDGRAVLKNLRRARISSPVLMLTALGDVSDRIAGLDGGADDYLTKPFHFGELLARIRCLTRRGSEAKTVAVEKFGVTIDASSHVATRDGKKLALTAKEFSLLELFVTHAGKVLTRAMISEHLWDMNFDPRSNVIEAYIKFLRQKVDKGFDHPLIHTIRGVGYMFADRAP